MKRSISTLGMLCFALVFILVALPMNVEAAQPIQSDKLDLSFDVPEGFSVEKEDDSSITLYSDNAFIGIYKYDFSFSYVKDFSQFNDDDYNTAVDDLKDWLQSTSGDDNQELVFEQEPYYSGDKNYIIVHSELEYDDGTSDALTEYNTVYRDQSLSIGYCQYGNKDTDVTKRAIEQLIESMSYGSSWDVYGSDYLYIQDVDIYLKVPDGLHCLTRYSSPDDSFVNKDFESYEEFQNYLKDFYVVASLCSENSDYFIDVQAIPMEGQNKDYNDYTDEELQSAINEEFESLKDIYDGDLVLQESGIITQDQTKFIWLSYLNNTDKHMDYYTMFDNYHIALDFNAFDDEAAFENAKAACDSIVKQMKFGLWWNPSMDSENDSTSVGAEDEEETPSNNQDNKDVSSHSFILPVVGACVAVVAVIAIVFIRKGSKNNQSKINQTKPDLQVTESNQENTGKTSENESELLKPVRFCPKCGYKQNKSDNRFCEECGFDFRVL